MQFHNHPKLYLQRFALLARLRKWISVLALAGLPQMAASETVTVFAPSSLRDALGDIAASYETRTGDAVVLVFAATSAIARQVARGAPADVVLLADQAWADWLVGQDTVDATRPFAGNGLVLVGQGQPPLTDVAQILAALGQGRLAMAQVDAVPAGRYGKEALHAIGLWDAVSPQVVQAANVRSALRFVERGEAVLGIGYASDLVALPSLSQVYAFAPDSHAKIVYSGADVTPTGSDFMDNLFSDSARTSLAKWGFTPVDAPQ